MTAIPAASVSLKTMADGTLRISFDIEPIHAQDAFKLFAAPGTQAAIAALKDGYANIQKYPAKDIPEKPKGGELCKWAVLRCKEDDFFRFMQEAYANHIGDLTADAFTTKEAFCKHAVLVMAECDESRSELDNDLRKAANFNKRVREPFIDWWATQ